MARRLPTLVVPKAANIPAGDVTGPEWSGLKSRIDPGVAGAPSEFAANIAGQMTWVKMPHIDPTLSAFGMSESNTDTANDAALLAAANAAVAAGATVKIPEGEFPLRQINAPYGAIIEGAGKENTKFVRSVGNASDRFTFKGIGTVGPAIPLAANTASYATSFTVATNPNLVPGDIVYVTDLRAPWGGSNYPGHDTVRVVSVTGTGPFTVQLGDALYHPFSTALSATMRKVTPWRGGFHGFTIEAVPGLIDANGIYIQYAGPSAEIGDVHVENWTTTAIVFQSCYRSKADRTSVANPAAGSSGYGYGHLIDVGSRGVDIGFGESRKARHGFDVTGGASESLYHDCTAFDPSHGPDFMTHGKEAYYNTFVNCVAYTGTTNWGFTAGNHTFGADFYTHFDRCSGFGAGPTGSSSPMFRAIAGSHGMRVTNSVVRGGYYGVYFDESNNCSVSGTHIINTRAAVYNQSSLGAIVTANMIDTTVISAVQAAANRSSCDGMIVTGNQAVNSPSPFTNLAGTGHQTANNVLR